MSTERKGIDYNDLPPGIISWLFNNDVYNYQDGFPDKEIKEIFYRFQDDIGEGNQDKINYTDVIKVLLAVIQGTNFKDRANEKGINKNDVENTSIGQGWKNYIYLDGMLNDPDNPDFLIK